MGGPLQQSASAGPHISSHGADTGDAVMARWLQSAGLQHLAAPLAAAALDHRLLPSLLMQDYARYGVQSLEDKQKLFRLIKTISSGAEPSSEPATPPYLRSGNRSGMDFLSPEFRGDFGAGILDLHSIDDSELFSEVSIPEPFHSSPSFVPVIEKGFENDFEPPFNISKSQNKSKFNESSPLRSNTLERERDTGRGAGRDNTVARIKVVVRKRPINKKELARKEDDIVTIEDNASVTVHEPKLKVDLTAYVEKHEFVFDAVLDESVSNDEVYNVTVEPIVPAIFQRTKATCFAYGQTGSGKTYTMQPLPLRASQDILGLMQQSSYKYEGFQLWLSFFEIYGGKLYDLLNERRKLCMREDGRQQVCIVGLKEYRVSDVQLVKEYIDKGNASRSTGSTGANEESSRSHAILQLVIKKSPDGSDAKAAARPQGKLSFIDLAGSERGADTTDNDRQTRMEGAEINKSLLALKECIRALDNDQGHIPFRGSKLTEVLRDSFVGDSRTVMISCISPNAGSCEHTLNTLRYADRVKGLSKSGSSKTRETSTITAPTTQRETTNSPPPAPTVQPQTQQVQVQEFQSETRGSERFLWQNQMTAEREGLSVSDYAFSGREESRTNSSFSGREDRGMNSNFQGRDERGINSGFSGRDESRMTSSFSGREESRISSFQGREESRNPSFQAREESRNPSFQGREESRNPSFQGREESRNPSFQGREESRNPSFQGREESRNPSFQGREESRNPSFQGREENRNPSFQGREESRNPSFQGREESRNSSFQGREESRNPSFQGREETRNTSFQTRDDNRIPSFQGREENRIPTFQGREQESRINSGFQGRDQESRMTSSFQGRDQESRLTSGYQLREQESRMTSGFQGREQESRMTSGFQGREQEIRMTSGFQGREQESRVNSGFSREQDGRMNSVFPGREQEVRMNSGFTGRDESRMTSVATEKDRIIFRESVEGGSINLRDMGAPAGNESLEQERHQLILPSRRKGSREEKSDRNSGQIKEELSRLDSMNGYQRRSNTKDELSLNAPQYSMKETDIELESIQTGYDGHINAILEEEEEVISAHRKEVEDTMEIVREEMKLLAEVDRPGSRIDRYVSQLNYVLSRKAAGIVNLQARLTKFQRHLKEQEILSRTTGLRQA